MPRKRKRKATTLQRIAKLNPRVDKKLVEESLALVDFVRGMGFRGRGYDIIESSESQLRLSPPVLFKL